MGRKTSVFKPPYRVKRGRSFLKTDGRGKFWWGQGGKPAEFGGVEDAGNAAAASGRPGSLVAASMNFRLR